MRLDPDVPFSPRRLPVFYGWVVVAAATVGVLFSIPGQTMGVSVFTDPLLAATGLSRLGFSNAYLVGTLGSAALLPRAGRWLDTVGVRLTAMLSAAGLAAVLVALSRADRIARAVAGASGVDPAVSAFAVLAALFVALRFTGQGVLTLASRTMLARWFDRRRGLATAVGEVFVAFGFAFAPRLLDAWIARAGWRAAWVELAAVEVSVMVTLAFVLYREDPESCGLALDGAPRADGDDTTAGPPEPGVDRDAALRTRAFRVLTASLALQAMALTGITLHVVDLGAAAGLDRAAAVSLFLPMAVVSTATGAVVGWLADRARISTLIRLHLAAQAVGYAAATRLGEPWGFALAAGALGVAAGCFGVLSNVGNPRLFGRRHLGAVAGATMTAVVVGSALGPSMLAASRAASGSYAPALLVAAGAALVLQAFTGRPLHPRDTPPPRI